MLRRDQKGIRHGRRLLAGLLAAAAVLGSLYISTLASESDRMPDLTSGQTGNLVVELTKTVDNEESKTELFGMQVTTGAQIQVYKVADLKVAGGSAQYELTSTYSSLKSSISFDGMNASQSSAAADLLKKFVESQSIHGYVGKTDSAGKVAFGNLEPGMYLVFRPESDLTKNADDQNIFSPFLVSVPIRQVDSGVNGWNYSVEAFPKLSDRNGFLETEPTESSETNPETNPPTESEQEEQKKTSSSSSTTSTTTSTSSPIKTGDDTNLNLWRWMLFISMAVVLIVFVSKQRNERRG